jgi:hypothetical protein
MMLRDTHSIVNNYSMKEFLQILFYPIARFCLRNGVLLPQCIDAFKSALLHAASDHLAAKGEAITASRLSVMSGVHRKDATGYLKGSKTSSNSLAPAIKILGAWHTKKKYLTAGGKPRTLSIGSEESEFAQLVRDVSTDVHPYTILKELERLNLVEVNSIGVKALKASFISAINDENTARIISRDINDLLFCTEENISAAARKPHHHTTTEYDNIPIDNVKALQEWIIEEGAKFHQKVREHVSALDRDLSEDPAIKKAKGRIRFSFCSFGRTEVLEK